LSASHAKKLLPAFAIPVSIAVFGARSALAWFTIKVRGGNIPSAGFLPKAAFLPHKRNSNSFVTKLPDS
jgi:hypothetical protein